MVREGQMMPAYYGETTRSCALDRCLERAKEMIGWDENIPVMTVETEKSAVSALLWRCRDREFRE